MQQALVGSDRNVGFAVRARGAMTGMRGDMAIEAAGQAVARWLRERSSAFGASGGLQTSMASLWAMANSAGRRSASMCGP